MISYLHRNMIMTPVTGRLLQDDINIKYYYLLILLCEKKKRYMRVENLIRAIFVTC